MRKYQKAAVVMAMLGSVGFLGAGVSHAGGEPEFKLNNKQSIDCSVDNSTKGLVNVDDVNVSLKLLGINKQEANDVNAPACSTNFKLGGKH
ncbi:hypothetical protein [Streptomyces sp. NPDC050388]|uniref:hypothetical protein n=1 Tax=Streptomyces sp. NPDC050388 TaxID=3155781 RepID=UPI00341EA336